MIEEWRPIEGYEELYEVSSYGRVRSLDRYVVDSLGHRKFYKSKVLSPAKDTDGYLKVGLSYNGKCKKCLVHRLAAQAFIPNLDNLPEVNHKDEDKTNNRVDNLEWCTTKYNVNYGTARTRSIKTKVKKGYVNEENVGLSKEEYNKKKYQENKDKICDRQRSYYQKNRDRICAQHKENYRKKKEMIQNNI